MNVKDPIRKRLNKGFLVISIVCCIGLVISDIALFAMSTSYNHAMANYGFSQGEIGKAMTVFSEARILKNLFDKAVKDRQSLQKKRKITKQEKNHSRHIMLILSSIW